MFECGFRQRRLVGVIDGGSGEMAITLAVLGLLVAFCGLWLATFALRKIESQLTAFLKGPVQVLRDTIMKNESQLNAAKKEVEGLKKQSVDAITALQTGMEQLRQVTAQPNKSLAESNAKVAALEQQLTQRRPGQRPVAPVAAPAQAKPTVDAR
jgi:hypothetical protein